MVGRWLNRITGNQVKWPLAVVSVMAFLFFCISIAWLFIILTQWSRDRSWLRVALVAGHFLYDCLIGSALWFLVLRYSALIGVLLRGAQMIADLQAGLQRLHDHPAQAVHEEQKTVDLLQEARDFQIQVKEFFEKRATKPITAAVGGGNG